MQTRSRAPAAHAAAREATASASASAAGAGAGAAGAGEGMDRSADASASTPSPEVLARWTEARNELQKDVDADRSQEIGFHGDFPSAAKMIKAVFMATSDRSTSVWRFRLSNGQDLGAFVIPSGSCLLATDIVLGMLDIEIGGVRLRIEHAVDCPDASVVRTVLQFKFLAECD